MSDLKNQVNASIDTAKESAAEIAKRLGELAKEGKEAIKDVVDDAKVAVVHASDKVKVATANVVDRVKETQRAPPMTLATPQSTRLTRRATR